MRKFLILLLTLLLLPIVASADMKLNLDAEAGLISYDFTTEKDQFVVITYENDTEAGRITLYAEDMHFSGDIVLAYSPLGGRTTVTVLDPSQERLVRKNIDVPKQKGYEKPTGTTNVTVKELVLTETVDGFDYSFTAEGSDYMMLYFRSKQQSATFPVYPIDDEGHYAGSVVSDLTYARTQFTVEVRTGGGKTKKEGTVRKEFAVPEAAETQPGRLSGLIVCIDPGHQENGKVVTEPKGPGLKGEVTGTLGMAQGDVTLRREYIVTLEAAHILRDVLVTQGATVVLTRESYDGYLTNLERCAIAEEAGAHIMLRLHCNNNAKTSKKGIQIYAPMSSDYAAAVTDRDTYRAMGTLLMNAMKDAVGYERKDSTGETYLSNNYVGNNWAKMMCFLVEMGYMSNAAEDVKLATPEYQQLLAEGMAQGVYEIAVSMGWIEAAE